MNNYPNSADVARMVARNLGFHLNSTDSELENTAAAFHVMEPELADNMARNWPTGKLVDVLKDVRLQLARNAAGSSRKAD